ncbi:uncharacterized protein LOC128508433 [Clarias gariepinus]|uniref:uncharacterized protein LOC128508433 n=1 Tax=Clarias gariepinus TaxID=13013 RepID=UPI00234C534B|nr:uncharacterized protein LOC128508433 [Clarias gariepinus]
MTEGWCYGSMSVVAPRKGHYCHRGLWEMTPDVLLLILALTACLTEPVRSEEDDGSGVQEKEAQVAKQMTSMTTIIHTSEVISVSDNPITVSTQDAEVSGLAETLAQVTSEKNSTEISNETHTKARNVTTEVKHDKGRKLPTNDTAGDEEDHQEEDENMGSSPEPEKTDDQETYIIVAASVTLAVLLAAAVVGLLFLCRRRRKNTPGEVELGMDENLFTGLTTHANEGVICGYALRSESSSACGRTPGGLFNIRTSFPQPPSPMSQKPLQEVEARERPTRAQLDIFSDLVLAECRLEAQTESLHHWNHVSLRPEDRFTEVVAL